MKRITLFLAVIIALVCIFAGCADSAQNPSQTNGGSEVQKSASPGSDTIPGGNGFGNPVVKTTAGEILEKTGIVFNLPNGAKNAKYFMINDELPEAQFDINNVSLCARIQGTADFTDISGMSYPWTNKENCKISSCSGRILRYDSDEKDVQLCLWYDVVPGYMYSLSAEGENLSKFDIYKTALKVYRPLQGDS